MRIAPILVLLLAAPGLAAEPDVAALCEEVRGLYEKASKELPFLATHDLIWNREITERMPGDAEERYTKQLVPLSFHHQSHFPAKVLLPLLEREDPKVRTLTLVGLFALEDPFLLPHIAGLVHDEAVTFSEPVEQFSYEGQWPRCVDPAMRVQTVGSVAQRMIRFYVERSRERIDFREDYWEQTWTNYCGPRAARGSCAGWMTT